MSNRHSKDKKGFIHAISPRADLKNLFIWMVGVSAVIYFTIYVILGNGQFSDIFFIRGGDFFMDCFNSIRDASQGSGVYSERGVIYPPMANLIFLLLSRFTPDAYNDTEFIERTLWTNRSSCILLVFVITAICFVALFALVFKSNKKGSVDKRMVFSAAVVLSAPMLFLMERGNMLVLCIISLLIYAFTYNSESKWKREIGLLALAFGFSLKLYPVVFGWFLIADKRYKDAIRCALYGLALLIIPSFFFGGPVFCVKYLFLNITTFSSGVGNTITRAMKFVELPETFQKTVNILAYVWVFICSACFAFSPFIRKDKPWKTWVLGIATILCVPSLTGIYNWAFLLIPLIMIANKNSFKAKDVVYFVFITIPFLFIPFRVSFQVTPMDILVFVMTAILSIFTVADTFVDLGKFISQKRAGSAVALK